MTTIHPAVSKSLECSGVTLILVGQGARLIGTNNSRADYRERPQSQFGLNYSLFMARTKVTWAQFAKVGLGDRSVQDSDDTPVIVTWTQANAFCERFRTVLEKQTGQRWLVRLPREAEWEYAACYGRDPQEDYWPQARYRTPDDLFVHAWFAGNSKGLKKHPVAQLKENPAGLYDMLGEVEEWCDGWYTESVTDMLRFGWKAEITNSLRPIRGSNSTVSEDDCRPSRRVGNYANVPYCGFRIVVLPTN
jgi:formylglycine-generating enzyme required for sulfatase activity